MFVLYVDLQSNRPLNINLPSKSNVRQITSMKRHFNLPNLKIDLKSSIAFLESDTIPVSVQNWIYRIPAAFRRFAPRDVTRGITRGGNISLVTRVHAHLALLPTKPLPARPMAQHTSHAYATVDTGVTPPPTLLLDAQQGHPTTVKVSAWQPHAQPAPKDILTH